MRGLGKFFTIDLDGWTYYNLPVVGQSAYLYGDRNKRTLASARMLVPKTPPSEYAEMYDQDGEKDHL